jgi:urease accessory protein
MSADAALTLVESVVFGRQAMGENVHAGAFRDRWRIRRDGRLVFAEDVHLDGAVTASLNRRPVANGARALATFLHIAPDAERQLEAAREGLCGRCLGMRGHGLRRHAACTVLGADPQALRADLARFIEAFRGAPMPRSWQT